MLCGFFKNVVFVPIPHVGPDTIRRDARVSGADRNFPIEIRRHFHPGVWIVAAIQLQHYASDPRADGMGIYLVFWFGNSVRSTAARLDKRGRTNSAEEMEAMLIEGLDANLVDRADVTVFDVSNPVTKVRKAVKPL